MATLTLSDGTSFSGESFGAVADCDGEVVFNTGMVGYPESLTDPSYRGQILVFTYPLVGNYGVTGEEKNTWNFSNLLESEDIHVRGVLLSQGSVHHSHHQAVSSFDTWLKHHNIPGITAIDTRAITKKLREHGVMLGCITQTEDGASGDSIPDPNQDNLVAEVSCTEVETYEPDEKAIATIVAFDCGMKRNIIRSFLKRGVKVIRVPWNFDLKDCTEKFDGVFVSNGPGDPKQCKETIAQLKSAIDQNIPTFGICLGNQLLALAIGGDTYKLKYGHRGANQPCTEYDRDGNSTHRCIITSQNHGFAVSDKLPKDWHVWFKNANDDTVEGIRHASGRFCSVQFHPEATPGPEDAAYLFDEFVKVLRK